MLVLTRKMQQQIQIGDNITITIVRVKGQAVRVGIDAPKQVHVIRGELSDRKAAATFPIEEPVVDEAEVVSLSAAPRSCEPSRSNCTPAEASDSSADETAAPLAAKLQTRRRIPGASNATMNRRPQRLGPASLRGLARMR